jgi:hypothetical protein
MPMKNPPHPGHSVRHDCIEPLGLTITDAAEILGVTRQALNNSSTARAGFQQLWQSVWIKPSAGVRRLGCGSKWPTTSHRPASMKAQSRSNPSRGASCTGLAFSNVEPA